MQLDCVLSERERGRSRAFRREKRRRFIERALSCGEVPRRDPVPTLTWALCDASGALLATRVRQKGTRPVGAAFVPAIIHDSSCPQRAGFSAWQPREFDSIDDARRAISALRCACPTESWTKLPRTPPGFFWVVVARSIPRVRAHSAALLASDAWQAKRTCWLRCSIEKDFAALYTRRIKLPRARALGIDWTLRDWDDEEFTTETRGRKLPGDARRYPRR